MSDNHLAAHIDVAKICELAQFDIPPETMEAFQGQLENILAYVAKLNELKLDGIEPTLYGQPVKNVFRDDVNTPSLPTEVVMANAPDRIGPEFRVPKIVE